MGNPRSINTRSVSRRNDYLTETPLHRSAESGRSRQSEVDSSYKISENLWIVSLVRQPDSLRSQHAFIIIEGIEKEQNKIWFVDFVSNGGWHVGTHNGKIRSFTHEKSINDNETSLIYFRQTKSDKSMMNPKPGSKIITLSWQVEATKLKEMLNGIEEKIEKKQFPKFMIVGGGTVFSQASDLSNPDEEGGPRHNCFTWAKEQLLSLKEDSIKQKLDDHMDELNWFAQITSRTLPDIRPHKMKSGYVYYLVGAICV